MQKAQIELVYRPDGTWYRVIHPSCKPYEFRFVTEAQIFMIENKIPFDPWE